jgi:hypothetical protein
MTHKTITSSRREFIFNFALPKILLYNMGYQNSKEKPTLCTELTPHWKARTEEQNLYSSPPVSAIFAYRTEANSFETFAR